MPSHRSPSSGVAWRGARRQPPAREVRCRGRPQEWGHALRIQRPACRAAAVSRPRPRHTSVSPLRGRRCWRRELSGRAVVTDAACGSTVLGPCRRHEAAGAASEADLAAGDARNGADAGAAARAPQPGPTAHLGVQVSDRGGEHSGAAMEHLGLGEACRAARAWRSREARGEREIAGPTPLAV